MSDQSKESDLLRGASLTVCRTLPPPSEENEATGIVLVGSISIPWERLHAFRCPIFMLPELPERCMGKIALMDTESGRLFVSPDLQVVSRYAPYFDANTVIRTEECGAEQTVGVCLRQWINRNGEIGWQRIGGWLEAMTVSANEADAEECLYERYRELAERNADSSFTVLLRFDRREEAKEKFRQQIRGIFRAAVYGRFSLLVDGCLTERDWRESLSSIHRCYCELVYERREFNGYIPKGLLLDRPLQLAIPLDKIGADFLCLDSERMLSAMTGSDRVETGSLTYEEQDAARRLLASLRSQRTGVPLCLLLRKYREDHPWERRFYEQEIDTWYVCREEKGSFER